VENTGIRYADRCPPTILNYHWEQFREAEQILIQQFNIPISYAADLLPRFDPQFMGEPVRRDIGRHPGLMKFGRCEDHKTINYHQYHKLRWIPPVIPDHDQDEAHQLGLGSFRCNRCLPQPIGHPPQNDHDHDQDKESMYKLD